ncbi:MAG: hypothetical protein JHD16_12110, partial [Solirubrobacteraceae bacterium]|nr:hypothetical protein [Solirubrobacteraceae bacterium]
AKCWGNNSLGQIGDGTLTEAPDEVSVSGLSTATALTAGFGQSCATISGSTLSCWGDAYYGQAGNGATAGNFSLTGLAAPVAGLTSIIPDPVAELPKGPPSQPDPPVTPQPPVVVPPVVDPPRPEPTLLFTKTKLKITALLLSPSGKSCPKKLTLTVSSGKTKQSGSVKTKKVTAGKKTKCSVTATFTIKNAKLKKAKSLKVRLSGKGIKTFTKTVKVTAAPKAA